MTVLDAVETLVCVCPPASVMRNVCTVGEGTSVAIAEALRCLELSSAEYVLVASAEVTTSPGVAEMEVLNVYAGVVNVGVERRKFGRVVASVAEWTERKEATSAAVSFRVVTFDMG